MKKRRKIPFLIKLIAACALPNVVIFLILVILAIGGAENAASTDYLRHELGLDKSAFTVVRETDTHGGFHGDGLYSVALNCSDQEEMIQTLTEGWQPLPLSRALQISLYGGEADGVLYGGWSEEAGIPQIENGYYYFKNRQEGCGESWTDLIESYSVNYTLAIFDSDTHILYFMCVDT